MKAWSFDTGTWIFPPLATLERHPLRLLWVLEEETERLWRCPAFLVEVGRLRCMRWVRGPSYRPMTMVRCWLNFGSFLAGLALPEAEVLVLVVPWELPSRVAPVLIFFLDFCESTSEMWCFLPVVCWWAARSSSTFLSNNQWKDHHTGIGWFCPSPFLLMYWVAPQPLPTAAEPVSFSGALG